MKSFLVEVLFRYKFAGLLLNALTSSAVAFIAVTIISLLPHAPEFVTNVIRVAMNLQPGAALTEQALVVALTPLVMVAFDTILKAFIAKWNLRAQDAATEAGIYDSARDAWIGPKFIEGLNKLATEKAAEAFRPHFEPIPPGYNNPHGQN